MLDIVNEPQRSALAIRITEDSLLLEAGLDVKLSPNATADVSYSGQLSPMACRTTPSKAASPGCSSRRDWSARSS